MKLLSDLEHLIQLLRRQNKFTTGFVWNLASLAVLAVSGLLINVVIGRVCGAADLGVFNQVFAIYIIAGQFAVGGLQFAVLKHIPQYRDDRAACNRIISASIYLTLVIGLTVASIVFILAGPLGVLLGSQDVAKGIPFACPAIVCFSLNKVLLAAVNGYRKMRAFAIFQALRYILMVMFLLLAMILQTPGYSLIYIVSGAEFIVTMCAGIYVFKLNKPVSPWNCISWIKELAAYGFMAFPGGAFLEINSRVDIIILGIFQTDQIVGIYSLAALLVEGVSLVTVALLVNINPIITATYFRNDRREFNALITDTIKYSYIMMTMLAILSCAVYPLFITIFMSSFMDSWPLFCILMVGLTASAGYFPLRILFSQTGHPGLQTLFFSLVLISNIILNLALVPPFGMYGAALATGIAYLLTSIYLKLIARYAMLLYI